MISDDKRKERFDNLITTSFPFCKPSIWRWVSAGKIFSHRKSHFSWLCSSASVNQRFLLNQSTGRSLANLLLSGMILGYEQYSDEIKRFFHLLRSFRKERFPGTAEILLSRGISPNCLRFSAQANLQPPHLLISSSPHLLILTNSLILQSLFCNPTQLSREKHTYHVWYMSNEQGP